MTIFQRLFGRPPDCNRGTLTLLPDATFIVGLPIGTTEEAASRIAKGVQKWVDSGQVGSVVFPFPVDVIDHRPRS